MKSHLNANPNSTHSANAPVPRHRPVEPEPDREAHQDRDREDPCSNPVSARARPESTEPRDRQAAQPIEETLLDVLRDAGGCAHAGEQHSRRDEARDEEVDVRHPPPSIAPPNT